MPGKIKVKVLAGRNLPVMDRAGDTTDAFVEIKFGGITHKTDVCRKSLNPHWNSTEWYRFEVDESELQDEPLQLRLMDHDTYSANDAIGKVVISLAPLLAREANNAKGTAAPPGGAVMSGWIPVFDTMHGIRGELNVIVKVELFSDFNKYKTSSCGVQFFHCPMIPPGYRATSIHGFTEELVVNDDPEYQWIDKIRTPRASNEARQVAFINLGNQVQRLVGLKAAELGANAVVGYQQEFDLEGEAGVVARAVGTAVSITPLPLPSQTTNIPPCTQQQLKKYLDILSTDDDNVTDLNQYYQTHQEELQKMLTILNPKTPSLLDETDNVEEDGKSTLTRQSSVKSYTGGLSIYQDDYVSQNSLKHIADDQTDLNKLLNRVDSTESSNPLKKIKKFKTNFFLKRLGSMRSKRTEKQDDQISIKSNSSDVSKISLMDVKNEIKKLRRLKKPKFRKAFVNVDDQGVGMASILARSVIHAHTSLACIVETQDSDYSPNSTLRRTSESEPTINVSDEDKARIATKNSSLETSTSQSISAIIPEIHFTSLKNVSSEDVQVPTRQRTLSESCPSSPLAGRSENQLKLPGEPGYFGSVSSALSGESSDMYSSSDEDDESSDQRTDTEKVIETTSSIVRSVMGQMEKKLSILDTQRSISLSEDKEENLSSKAVDANSVETDAANKNLKHDEDIQRRRSLHCSEKESTTCVAPKSNSYHFKFHNPFIHKKTQSISAPSSPVENTNFVYRSSKKIKNQLTKLSKSSMMISLSHYSLIPKKKQIEPKTAMSQPGSSSDVASKAPSDTVLGSPFLSYADLLSLDKEGLEPKRLHKSDEFNRSKVSMYIGSEPASRASFSGTLFPEDIHIEHHHQSHKKEASALKPTGLLHTAMETILIDKVQSLLIPTSPDPIKVERKFFDDVTEKLGQVEEVRNSKPETTGLVHTAMETMLMDKVQSLIPASSPPLSPTKTSFGSEKNYSHNSVESDKSNSIHSKTSKKNKDKNQESTGLVHTAMETMLIDKVQSLFSAPVPLTAIEVDVDNAKDRKQPTKEISKGEESTGLINTAVKTILLDRAQALIDSESITSDINTSTTIPENKIHKERTSSTSSSNFEKESSLVDRVHSFFSAKDRKKSNESINSETKPGGLIHSAVETMLIDKIQSLLPNKDAEDKDVRPERKLEEKDSLSKERKLVRQSSIHSDSDNEESCKMSKTVDSSPNRAHALVLQNFHPLLSGAVLETIPSLPESSFDRTESLDVDGLATCSCKCDVCGSIDTNSASVCGNSHAACDVCRCERDRDKGEREKGSPRHARHESYGGREPVAAPQAQNSSLNASSTPMGIHRRSSDSDLSVTPKGSSLNTSAVNTGSGGGAILRPSMNSNNLDMLEYPFLTMTEYPPGFIVHIGGTVCARSVKLVDGGGESAARAAWWAELRTELRAHARALRCNAVIAYTDTAAICEDVCVLSASGTAAVINLDCDFNAEIDAAVLAANGPKGVIEEVETECSIAHVPYSPGAGPYRAELASCGGCRRARVPNVLLATCSKPNRLLSFSKAVTLTAVAARTRRAPPASEPGARDISDQLPFLEYELHKLLLAKLRMQGANALFNLQTQITIGERCVMALASGTAVRLVALPPPAPPRIKATENDKEALEIQKALWDSFTANKAANGYDVGGPEHNGALPEIEGEEPPALDLCADKDACVLELDEAEDVETARTLAARRPHTRLQVYTDALQPLRAAPPYAFTQVWRGKISTSGGGIRGAGERQVGKALDALAYKLRRLQPAALLAASFRLDLPEDEIQLVVSGAAIRLRDPAAADARSSPPPGRSNGTGDADDDIFTLDEEQLAKSSEPEEKAVANGVAPTAVSLTSLCYISGARVVRRVCALRLLFVRETTTVRELGGLSGFLHTFTSEVLAIVRAYTTALGGNALTSFYITQLMLQDNAHKNQGQCLLSVGGDVVHITY